MNSQFKFKPDKIKYLSSIDTLDSSHKKFTEEINKKKDDIDKKTRKLTKYKNDLEEHEKKRNDTSDIPLFIEIKSKLVDSISNLQNEIEQINNYEEETEYYSKTYQMLFNYYDVLDGQIDSEINNQSITNESNNIDNNNELNNNIELNNLDNLDKKIIKNEIDEWDFDGIQIFNSTKTSTLDTLNELSKKKRKEKKNTKKRVKNVESLIRDNNYDIFEFINSNNISLIDDITNTNDLINNSSNIINSTNTLYTNNLSDKNYDYNIFDRAILYDDYKISLEGYNSKKNNSKNCDNCKIDKVLIYSEGIYACMNCGEVENCIIESEITNYKEPMVDKPTFPYKRKNHFCEWTKIKLNTLLVKVI
jgi:hypothetical protein